MTEDKNTNDSFENNFFERMENASPQIPQRKLYRSKNDVMIAGVCAGIASYLKVEAANMRLIMILSLLLGGWSVLAYLLLAVLIPQEKYLQEITNEEKNNLQKENFKVLVSGILMLVGFYYSLQEIGFSVTGRSWFYPNSFMVAVISLTAGTYLIARKRFANQVQYIYVTKDFARSRKHRWFMGVCGGLADYLGTDAGTLRIMFVIFAALTVGLFSTFYFIIAATTKYENATLDEK